MCLWSQGVYFQKLTSSKKRRRRRKREKRLYWRIIEFLLLFVKVIGFKVIYVLDLKGFAIQVLA